MLTNIKELNQIHKLNLYTKTSNKLKKYNFLLGNSKFEIKRKRIKK